MRFILIVSLLMGTFSSWALTKKQVDEMVLYCTQRSVIKNFRALMENDLEMSPNSRTLVLLRNSYEKQDHKLVFDDSGFVKKDYFSLSIKGAMIGRFRFRFSRPLVHFLDYKLESKDEDGYVKTSLGLNYVPRQEPRDKVELRADYLPSVVYEFSNIVFDQFGRISPDSEVSSYKILEHPVFGRGMIPFKDIYQDSTSDFHFDAEALIKCIQGSGL